MARGVQDETGNNKYDSGATGIMGAAQTLAGQNSMPVLQKP